MKRAIEHIRQRQVAFSQNRFFRRLEGVGSPEAFDAFAPHLTFFVMVFQDILRLCAERMENDSFRTLAFQHAKEDQHHESWFLEDLQKRNRSPSVRALFSDEHRRTRDVTHQLMSEVFRAPDDHARLLLVEVLEATGHVFFSRVPGYLARSGLEGSFRYFSRAHNDIEQNHALFEDEVESELASAILSESAQHNVREMIDRSFDAMTTMVAGFDAAMDAGCPLRVVGGAR